MKTISRYIRAFFIALRMTLRGEKLPERPHPELTDWTREMLQLVDEVYAATESAGLDKAARQSIIVRLDGRPMNLNTILGTLRYHASQEFPSLLRSGGRFNRGAILATNANNRYWITRLLEDSALQAPPIQASLTHLNAHLDAIPAQTSQS